jgi:hypothetical protein
MPASSSSFFRIRFRTIILLIVVAMILWSALSYWQEYTENSARRARELLSPPVGMECRIRASGNQSVQWEGKIVEQSDRWIVLQLAADPNEPGTPAKQVWIPRERIESIEIY